MTEVVLFLDVSFRLTTRDDKLIFLGKFSTFCFLWSSPSNVAQMSIKSIWVKIDSVIHTRVF